MQFAKQGMISAKDELIAVQMSVQQTYPQYRFRFAYLARALQDLSKNGMLLERSKWIATSNASVFVYTGDPEGNQYGGSHIRVWAAVEVDVSGQLIALLRVADGYQGDSIAYANYETEALQRLKGGRIP